MSSGFPPSLLDRLSFLLGKLYFRILDLEVHELALLDVSVKQHAVLTVLAADGPMPQQELGHRLGIDRTTIVDVVDGLDQKGLIERRRNPADRRAYLLTLTPSGERARDRGADLVGVAERKLLGALDEQERRILIGLLARVLGGR